MVISPNFPSFQTKGIKHKGPGRMLASKIAMTGMENGRPISPKERAYMQSKSSGQRVQESLAGGMHSITEAPAGVSVGGTQRHNGKGVIGVGALTSAPDLD